VRYRLVFIFTFYFFVGFIPCVSAQLGIPRAAESGLSEKSLRQSQQNPFQNPELGKPEIIVIDDSRKLIDPGAGPAFFVKKIITEGNTLFDDEALAPILNIEYGIEMTLGILALFAQEITAFYSQQGYFLTKAFVPKQEINDGVVKIQIN
jgi:hemolysin activation/secretion protein